MRKRIEELFGEAKEFMGFRRAKFRREKFVKEQILMTAMAQNIKRMVKLLSGMKPKGAALAVQKPLELGSIKGLSDIFALLSQNINKILFSSENWLVEN